jgi:general stress protein 26
MKIEEQRTAALRHLAGLVDGVDVAMLTTHAEDGSMVSRPLQVLKFDGDGEFVFFTAIDSFKVAQLDEHADVNLAFADPRRHRFVSVRGSARIDRDRATIEELWSVQQRVFFPRGKDDPHLAVLRVRVRDAAYWEPAGGVVARALDFVHGLVSEQPADLGRHGILHAADARPPGDRPANTAAQAGDRTR